MDRLEACLARAKNKYGSFLVMRKTPQYARNFAEHCSNLQYEPPVVKELETLDYNIFIDVGAAFGYHSIIASHFAEDVLAFEPHPIRHGLLTWNTRDLYNIRCSNSFIGPSNSDVYVPPRTMGSVGNRRGDRTFNIKNILDIETVPLSLLLTIPAYIDKNILVKIDVEGNELDVLDSTGDYISNTNLTWIVERHPWNASEKDIISRFEPHGYNHKLIFGDQKATYVTEIYKFWR